MQQCDVCQNLLLLSFGTIHVFPYLVIIRVKKFHF